MDRISSRPPEYLSPVHTCMYMYLYLIFNFPACLMRRSVYSEGKHNKKFTAQIAFGALLLLLLLFLLLLMLLLATQVFTNFPGTFSLFCPWSAAALFLCNFQIDCKHVTVGQPAPPLIAPPCHAPSLPPTQLIFSHILQQHALTLSVWFGSFRLYDFFACWPAAWHSVTFPLCDLLPLSVPHNPCPCPCHAPRRWGILSLCPPKNIWIISVLQICTPSHIGGDILEGLGQIAVNTIVEQVFLGAAENLLLATFQGNRTLKDLTKNKSH